MAFNFRYEIGHGLIRLSVNVMLSVMFEYVPVEPVISKIYAPSGKSGTSYDSKLKSPETGSNVDFVEPKSSEHRSVLGPSSIAHAYECVHWCGSTLN